ncbi:hypothetical protein OE749_01075 [Aestuariibacter sp. AA17]|uniref:EF-hand domain-containing protein n=1 Tax=Fluctibacter corallii TaxID=2984329 RepID=A0ABT3A3P2_9ALTE|nr:hypothetical protein [Aestuariibacter sp. AA17]MCV2883286.1 hypothetical protein [Aestuariibacter sp. AA17]
MFKKTLLALAMAGVAGAASAGSIAVTNVDVSTQGYAAQTSANQKIIVDTATATNAADDIVLTVGTTIVQNDRIVFTISGATIDSTQAVDVQSSVANGVSLLSATGNQIVVRATADLPVSGPATITISDLHLLPTSTAKDHKITIQSKAIYDDGEYDAAPAVTVATFVQDFSANVKADSSLDGVIDVGTSRTQFIESNANITSDKLVLELGDATADIYDLVIDKVEHTVQFSDLSFALAFDANSDGKISGAEVPNLLSGSVSGGVNADTLNLSVDVEKNTVKVTQVVDTELDSEVTLTFTVDGTADYVIPEQSFTGTVVGFDGTVEAPALSGELGSWVNNGTTFHVPFMVFDSKHASAVVANNRSSIDAKVELVLYVNGTAVNVGSIGTLAGNGSMNFASAIAAAAAANNAGATFGFDLVFEGTAKAIDISAQYVNKTSGSRAVIQTTEL